MILGICLAVAVACVLATLIDGIISRLWRECSCDFCRHKQNKAVPKKREGKQ